VNRRPELIETVRVRGGAAPLWGHHLARLFAACRGVGVEPPGVLITPEGGEDRIHRLLVSGRGVETTERAVGSAEPVRLLTSPVPHAPYPWKTTNRAPFERALDLARAAGSDDAILLAGGWAAETAIWSLFWWDGQQLCAPPRDLGILDSVARRRIGELTQIVERKAVPAELVTAGVFVANAARGVVAVASVDGRAVHFSERTKRLVEAFWG